VLSGGKTMRIFNSPRWTRCLQVSRMTLMVVVMLRSRSVIAGLITISTDNLSETNEYRSGFGAHWPFLFDAGRRIQKDLDIAEYTDPINQSRLTNPVVELTINANDGCQS